MNLKVVMLSEMSDAERKKKLHYNTYLCILNVKYITAEIRTWLLGLGGGENEMFIKGYKITVT